MPVTHGGAYQEAAPRGRHALKSLIEQALKAGKPLPAPAVARQGVA